jgi:hypothetical protein
VGAALTPFSASKNDGQAAPLCRCNNNGEAWIPTPRRTLDASPVADAVVLTMNGERECRLTH